MRTIAQMILTLATGLDREYAFQAKNATTMDKDAKVFMWAETLHPDTTMEDARRAVIEHYKTTDRPIMPVHVNKLTAGYRAERVQLDFVQIPYPEGLGDDPCLEVKWRTAWLDRVKAGDSPTIATRAAWAAIGHEPPKKITSAAYVDVKDKLAKFRKNFARKENHNG